jgi:hypothetical protein
MPHEVVKFEAANLGFPITLYDAAGVGRLVVAANGDVSIAAGATAKLGFYGLATPIALQTGVAVTAAGIHAALVALNLFTA